MPKIRSVTSKAETILSFDTEAVFKKFDIVYGAKVTTPRGPGIVLGMGKDKDEGKEQLWFALDCDKRNQELRATYWDGINDKNDLVKIGIKVIEMVGPRHLRLDNESCQTENALRHYAFIINDKNAVKERSERLLVLQDLALNKKWDIKTKCDYLIAYLESYFNYTNFFNNNEIPMDELPKFVLSLFVNGNAKQRAVALTRLVNIVCFILHTQSRYDRKTLLQILTNKSVLTYPIDAEGNTCLHLMHKSKDILQIVLDIYGEQIWDEFENVKNASGISAYEIYILNNTEYANSLSLKLEADAGIDDKLTFDSRIRLASHYSQSTQSSEHKIAIRLYKKCLFEKLNLLLNENNYDSIQKLSMSFVDFDFYNKYLQEFSAIRDELVLKILHKLRDKYNTCFAYELKDKIFGILSNIIELNEVNDESILRFIADIYFENKAPSNSIFQSREDNKKKAKQLYAKAVKSNPNSVYSKWMLKRIELEQMCAKLFKPTKEVIFSEINELMELALRTYFVEEGSSSSYAKQYIEDFLSNPSFKSFFKSNPQEAMLIEIKQTILSAVVNNKLGTLNLVIKSLTERSYAEIALLKFVHAVLQEHSKSSVSQKKNVSHEMKSMIYKSIFAPISYEEAMRNRKPQAPTNFDANSQYLDLHLGFQNSTFPETFYELASPDLSKDEFLPEATLKNGKPVEVVMLDSGYYQCVENLMKNHGAYLDLWKKEEETIRQDEVIADKLAELRQFCSTQEDGIAKPTPTPSITTPVIEKPASLQVGFFNNSARSQPGHETSNHMLSVLNNLQACKDELPTLNDAEIQKVRALLN